MNLSLDGYIAAPRDDIAWSVPSTQIEFARRWRGMTKVVFSSTSRTVDWNARVFTGDAFTEITRLKVEEPW